MYDYEPIELNMARPRKNPLTIDKICPTCNKTFTISYRKNKQIFCSKTCAQHNPSVLEKMEKSKQKTYNEKYNGLHPMQTKQTVDNFKKSLFKNHGDNYFKEYLVEKTKESKLKKYGNANYNNIEKVKLTCLEKYGVDNFVKTEEYKELSKDTCLEKYGVDHPSKSEQYRNSHYKNMFNKFENDEDFKNFEPQFTLAEYQGVTHGIQKYPFKCKRCNNTELHKIGDGFFPICVNCDKLQSSFAQKEIYDFIKELLGNDEIVLMNDRTVIYPKELDIYIPSKKLAIKNKVYHLNKTKSCIFKEIQLIHIFENEWKFKKEIVKSILRYSTGSICDRVYARECELREVSYQDASIFLQNNHIQGDDKSAIRYGLYKDNMLVSIMTFKKSRFDKNYEYEISRFCNLINFGVVGGANKLFSHFMKTISPTSVVSYSDRRYFNGNVYTKLGFTFSNITTPNYYYITDKFKNVKNRMSFQKHKLKKILPIFDENISEWENMKINGFDRIWDCGHSKWILRTK